MTPPPEAGEFYITSGMWEDLMRKVDGISRASTSAKVVLEQVIGPKLALVDAHEVDIQRAKGSLQTIRMVLVAFGAILPLAGGAIGWFLHR